MSSRQFYIVFLVFVMSLKIQKLPCIMYGINGKDSYISILLYLAVNLIGILLAFLILKRTKGVSFMDKSKSLFFEILKKLILISVTFYFLMQALLMYESMQNLFEHTLFENLSWVLFSLLLLFCVFYLALTGIKNIALNFEIYFFVILVSYIVIAVFGGMHTDFSVVLPFQTINFGQIINKLVDFNIWFGDFFIVLFLGKCSKNIKLGWTMLTYTLAILFIAFLNIEFAGIYLDYSPMQSGLIINLSEQSMLGLNIGRVDWFLILMVEFGTILSCGVCFYFAGKCVHATMPKVRFSYILVAMAAILYIFDIFVLKDTHSRVFAIIRYFDYIAVVIKWVVFILLVIISLKSKSVKTDLLQINRNVKLEDSQNLSENQNENISTKNTKIKEKKKTKQKLDANINTSSQNQDEKRGGTYEKVL